MLQTPDTSTTEPDLSIPPPVVFKEEKKKSKYPLWLIILFAAGLIISISVTVFIVISRNSAVKQAEQPRTIVITSTPVPVASGTQQQTATQSGQLYTNKELKFTARYPINWREDPAGNSLFGTIGKLYIDVIDQTDASVIKWFDVYYIGRPDSPKLRNTYTNPAGVTFLETAVQNDKGPLKYFFINTDNKVIALTFTSGANAEENKTLEPIYGGIVESIQLIQ